MVGKDGRPPPSPDEAPEPKAIKSAIDLEKLAASQRRFARRLENSEIRLRRLISPGAGPGGLTNGGPS